MEQKESKQIIIDNKDEVSQMVSSFSGGKNLILWERSAGDYKINI